MQKLTLILICFIVFITTGCQEKKEPSPVGEISSMSVSARKVDGTVILNITALTFGESGMPIPVNFEQAEVWVSEGAAGYSNMKLTNTTTATTVKLEALKADKTYYVAVKGIKNGVKTEFSKAIMFTTSSLKPTETLLELQNNWFMSSSADSSYLAYVDANTGEVILQNWRDKTKQVIFKNSASKSYQVKGIYSQGTLLVLETTRNRERAYDYYDFYTKKFTEIPMPEGARVWNCAFSPDGFKMAYTDYNRAGLYIYDVVLKQSRLYSEEFFSEYDWAVDGKYINQIRNVTNGSLDAREIVKWDLANGKQAPVRLFEWPDAIQWMSFSHDEQFVLFSSYVSNNADLWIYELKTGKTWQISDVSNFGWLSETEFFVNTNKTGNETTWKTYKYKLP